MMSADTRSGNCSATTARMAAMLPITPDLSIAAIRAVAAEQFPDLVSADIIPIAEGGGCRLCGADAPVARLAEGVDAVRHQPKGDDAQQQRPEWIAGQRHQRSAQTPRLAGIML